MLQMLGSSWVRKIKSSVWWDLFLRDQREDTCFWRLFILLSKHMELLKLCQLTGKFNQSLLSWEAPEHSLPLTVPLLFSSSVHWTKCQLDLTYYALHQSLNGLALAVVALTCNWHVILYFDVLVFFVPVGEGKKYIFSLPLNCQVVKTIFGLLKQLLLPPTT